jgi:hypothetical protein
MSRATKTHGNLNWRMPGRDETMEQRRREMSEELNDRRRGSGPRQSSELHYTAGDELRPEGK